MFTLGGGVSLITITANIPILCYFELFLTYSLNWNFKEPLVDRMKLERAMAIEKKTVKNVSLINLVSIIADSLNCPRLSLESNHWLMWYSTNSHPFESISQILITKQQSISVLVSSATQIQNMRKSHSLIIDKFVFVQCAHRFVFLFAMNTTFIFYIYIFSTIYFLPHFK